MLKHMPQLVRGKQVTAFQGCVKTAACSAHRHLRQQPHERARGGRPQAAEQVGALARRQRRRQVLLRAAGRADERACALVHLACGAKRGHVAKAATQTSGQDGRLCLGTAL